MSEFVSMSVITAPASEPITLAEAKLHCKSETDADDARFTSWIVAAREVAEMRTNRALITQTREVKFSDWPGTDSKGMPMVFRLPGAPLTSVASVKYYDTDGTEQTLASTVYDVLTASMPGEVVLKPGQSWPAIQSGKRGPITIRYVCGHANAAAVPEDIKVAMFMLIENSYQHRGPAITGTTVNATPFGAEVLLDGKALPGVG